MTYPDFRAVFLLQEGSSLFAAGEKIKSVKLISHRAVSHVSSKQQHLMIERLILFLGGEGGMNAIPAPPKPTLEKAPR